MLCFQIHRIDRHEESTTILMEKDFYAQCWNINNVKYTY